ncbi:hypothetical protein CPB83DRAFT_927460 [Crepidotus variabilis]|uniref:Uncharacterized protein n=1 Tax=Crepidotus variabilis TaxID=179855 RepID=A0A9P6EHS6_9AGAR|nr:hypothetical protein CPB83DRAFT_927460 [Crepidotus variabilis]
MASLSDQIDRLTRITRNIKTLSSTTADQSSAPPLFTRAVLQTHIGDLIRDVDPSELGLFSLSPNDKETVSSSEHLTRTQFHGATPLRRRPNRQDHKQEIEPEVYGQAALKYIDQFGHIRPMPRAYDQIVNILERLNHVRENIEQLNLSLKQSAPVEESLPIKAQVEQEERNIKDLQARISELSKKPQTQEKPESDPPNRSKSPSSPQEAQFWSAAGDAGRTLRFADNLLDEEVDIQDFSMASFDSPSTGSAHLGKSKMFIDADSFIAEPTITHITPPDALPEEDEDEPFTLLEEQKQPDAELSSVKSASPRSPPVPPPSSAPTMNGTPSLNPKLTVIEPVDTPSARSRKVKVNREVERIVTKIWATISDIIPPPNSTTSPSVAESILYLQQLALRSPQLDSPTASGASSAALDTNTDPSLQQVLTAHLLTMLLQSPPQYSLPLNQVKDGLSMKAKTSGVNLAGQGTIRVLYGCVAKRLVKIDRGGREQNVKFDT